jgi:predicted phosphodiesterase
MKTLLIADLHLTDKQEDSYRWNIFNFLMTNICHKYSINRIIIVGDLTEKKNYHSDKLVNRIRNELVGLYGSCNLEHIIILKGNHDYDNCPDNSFFKFLGELDFIEFIDRNKKVNDEFFICNTKNYDDFKNLDFTGVDTVYMHQCVLGAVFANMYVSDKGINIKKMIPGNIKVYSGDIHVPQKLGKNFTYIGAPYSIDYGDHYDGRVLITEDGKEDIELFPEFLKKWSVKIRDVIDLEKYKLKEGDKIKVEIQLFPHEFYDWESRKNMVLIDLEDKGVEVKGISMKPIKVKQRPRLGASKEDVSINKMIDDIDWVTKHCNKEGLDEEYKKVGLSLMD